MRYFLELSYSGKAYNGWQIQNNAPSVQQTLQEALSTILRVPTGVVGAGRTDTGVHAARYVAHFDAECPLEEPQRFCYHLNAILPWDIAVQDVRRVRDDAHARFDAVEREYKYYVSPRKDPFRRDVAYQLIMPLDLDRMNEALDYIEGNLDGKIDLSAAARLACCSVYHFQRMFPYITGIPLSEYIRRRRMTRAAFSTSVRSPA